jgi:exodeoxyribonuclease-3
MSFKVTTFNILVGGGEQERFDQVLATIKQISPNLLILQECLGWENGKRLSQVAQVMNAKFSFLGNARPRGSGNSYNVAVLSTLGKEEFLEIKTHNDSAFLGHCILELTLKSNLKIFATHFDSHSENLRFVEARYLRSLIKKNDFENGEYLLAGDLNALSLKDPYPTNFAQLIKESNTTKYSFPPRFEVIEEIESFGWIDSLYCIEKKDLTWVTAPRLRGGIKIDYRTDYIFVSPKLAKKLENVEIFDCKEASDHFPVTAIFRTI